MTMGGQFYFTIYS